MASQAWRLWRCNEVRVRNSTKDLVNYTWVEVTVDPTKMDPMQETVSGANAFIVDVTHYSLFLFSMNAVA